MTVSVVLCTYNGAKYLAAQIDSIISQTYPVDEIVVQDDGSTDETMEILRHYSGLHPNIKVYQNEMTLGVNNSFLSATERASGDYISWCDQDDIWHPDKISRQMELLLNSEVMCVCHSSYLFYGETAPDSFSELEYDHRIPNNGLERILFTGCMSGHTMMFKRELFQYAISSIPGPIFPVLFQTFFYDTVFSIVANSYGKIPYIAEPLALHRRFESCVTYKSENRQLKRTRSLNNAVDCIVRNLNLARRRKLKEKVVLRFDNMTKLLSFLPETDGSKRALKIIKAYKSPLSFLLFPIEIIRNRDRVFYSKEKNFVVSIARSLLFRITMYDYFE